MQLEKHIALARTLERLAQDPDYVDLETHAALRRSTRVDLKYAQPDNFMGADVYGPFKRAFLHREAAEKLERAAKVLKRLQPDWRFLVFDALRPRSIQRVLWDHVKGTEEERYVANPDRGSVHNFGFAIDLTLEDEFGQEVPMGSSFDAFVPLSQPKLEDQHLASGLLKREYYRHRLILREAMEVAGFIPLAHEWWHFDALPGDEVRRRFELIE